MTLEQYQTMLSSGVSGGYEGPFTPGYINWSALPGYESFATPASGNGDNYQEAGLRLPELYQYLDQNQIKVKEDILPDRGFTRYAVDASGNPIEATRITGRDDSFGDILKDVGKLAAIMGTAYLGGTALAGSGAAAGTTAGATPSLLSPDLGSAIAASASEAVPSTMMGASGMDAAVAASASGSTGSSLGNMATNAMNWMKANPTAGRLLMSGATSLLSASGGSGGSSGGYKDSGYRPTITRGGWNPNPQAQQMPMQRTLLNLPTTGNQNSGLWRYGLLGG